MTCPRSLWQSQAQGIQVSLDPRAGVGLETWVKIYICFFDLGPSGRRPISPLWEQMWSLSFHISVLTSSEHHWGLFSVLLPLPC